MIKKMLPPKMVPIQTPPFADNLHRVFQHLSRHRRLFKKGALKNEKSLLQALQVSLWLQFL